MSWATCMAVLSERKKRYDKINEIIAKVTSPELKERLTKARDEYWKTIELLGKPDYTEEDRKKIQQEHNRMDRLLCEMDKIAEDIPIKHILYCDYHGYKFSEEIDALQVGIPYEDDDEAYREKLNFHIDKILAKQNLEKLMDVHYTGIDVEPKGHFIYSEVLQKIAEKRPYRCEIEVKLDNIGPKGNIINTEDIDIAGFFKRHPEYLQKPYMLKAANEYIAVSIREFLKEGCWQFELYNDNGFAKKFCRQFKLHNSGCFPVYELELKNYDYRDYGIAHGLDNPENWPIPQKDGTWINDDGEVMYPRILFGLKDKATDDEMWIIDGSNIKFWFNEKNANCYIESDNNELVNAYRGYLPNINKIREKCPINLDPADTPESIKEKIQAFFIEQYKIVQQVPAKHVLYCNYPGLEFRTEFVTSNMNSSYEEDEYVYYREELEELIYNVLGGQDIEKLLDVHYTEVNVEPRGCFTYYEVQNEMQADPPHNEKVKIFLDTVNNRGDVIKNEEIEIMDFFVVNPEFFQEGGMWGATDEYVGASLKKFEKESCWHIALRKGQQLIENINQWPSPGEDELWSDIDGTEMAPYIWFGSKDDKVNIENELWNVNNIKFWFSEDPSWDILNFCNDEDYYSYGGFVPDVEAIRKRCPIVLERNDTPERLKEKALKFAIEQYQKQLTSASTKESSSKVHRKIDYDKAYRNCREVPDLYCIHAKEMLEECQYIPKKDSASQES